MIAKRNRLLLLSAGVIGVFGLAALFYFTVYRVQDSEYEAANRQIDTILTRIAEFEAAGSELYPPDLTESQAKEAKAISESYIAALAAFEKSRVVTADSEVADAYSKMKSKLFDYGRSSKDMVTTAVAVANIKQQCNILLEQIQTTITQDAANKASESCKSMLKENTSVPLADFNNGYFQPYHQGVSDVVKALDDYYTAGQDADSKKQQEATAALSAALDAVATLNDNNTLLISTTDDPTKELQALKTLIENRRKTN